MLIKTHLSITLFFILIFLSGTDYKLVFVLTAIAATFLPDLDSKNSKLGRKKIFRPFQFFVKHRKIMHSFTFLFIALIFIYFYVPILFQGFFLGYFSHLFADILTVRGIYPLYPLKKKISFKIRTGGASENFIYFIFFILDFIFLFDYLLKYVF